MRQTIVVMLICIAAVALFWQSFGCEKLFLDYDGTSFFYFEKSLEANSFLHGRLPLWNNLTFSGVPLLANSQAAVFYPSNLFILFLPVERALMAMFILNVIVAGICMFFFVKNLGLPDFAAIISAIMFMASGQMISRILAGHLTLNAAYSLIPLVFLFIERAIRKKDATSFVLLGIVTALQFFSGFYQIFYFTILFGALFGAFLFWRDKKKNAPATAKGIAVALIVFVFLSAVQLLPSAELAPLMTRFSGTDKVDQGSYSMPFGALIEILSPLSGDYWGAGCWEFTPFIGVCGFMLFLIGAIFSRKNELVIFFVITAIASIVFSFGTNIPFFDLSSVVFSPFGIFRAPARLLAIYCFSASLVAGFGAKAVAEANKPQRKKILISMAVALIIIIFCGFLIQGETLQSVFPQKMIGELVPGFFSAALGVSGIIMAIFLYTRKETMKFAPFFLVLIVFAELFSFSQPFLEPKTNMSIFDKTSEIIAIEKEAAAPATFSTPSYSVGQGQAEPFRVFMLEQSLSARYGIEQADGYDPTILTNYYEFFYEPPFGIPKNTSKDGIPPELVVTSMANVKFFFNDAKIVKNPLFLPRAYVVGRAEVVKKGAALEKIYSENFSPVETVLLYGAEGLGYNGNSGESFFVPVLVKEEFPERMSMHTDTEKDGFLVLSSVYYPGWKATVDGKETKVFEADHALMAIHLEKGKHDVVFSFEPDSVKIGALLSFLSLLFLALFCIYKKRTGKELFFLRK